MLLPMAIFIPWTFCAVWYVIMWIALHDAIAAFQVTIGWLIVSAHVTYRFRKNRAHQPEASNYPAANLDRAPKRRAAR